MRKINNLIFCQRI